MEQKQANVKAEGPVGVGNDAKRHRRPKTLAGFNAAVAELLRGEKQAAQTRSWGGDAGRGGST